MQAYSQILIFFNKIMSAINYLLCLRFILLCLHLNIPGFYIFSFPCFNPDPPPPPPPSQDFLCPCYLPAHKDRGTRLPQRMRTRILTPTPPRLPYFLVSRLLASLQPTVPSYMDAEKGERGGVRKGVSCMGTF